MKRKEKKMTPEIANQIICDFDRSKTKEPKLGSPATSPGSSSVPLALAGRHHPRTLENSCAKPAGFVEDRTL